MKKGINSLLVMLLLCASSYAQTGEISGTAVDEASGRPLAGTTASLLFQRDSSLFRSAVTDSIGAFRFGLLPPDSFIVTLSYVGYQQYVSFITINENERDLGEMKMFKQGSDLTAVTIVAKIPPVTQKGDTAQYNASQFKVNPDANAEDLIKKMPGITVDRAGAVTAHGEQVRNVTVDGKKFFGDDATAALKNLPAEIIDKIQVFDKLSDQAQFTGFDDGSATKAINIVTKSGTKNGQFGRVYAGYGTDDRYAAGGNVSFFKGDRRISLVGLFNNVNQQNFSSEDLLGVSGGGGGRGGRGRGNFGGGNFFVGQQSGISRTSAFGINYGDMWGKKLEVTGSYFFNNANTNNDQVSNAQYFIKDSSTQLYDESNFSGTDNFNNRVNMRFEYKLDSSNSFIFSPSLSFQDNDRSSAVNGVRYYTLNDLISRTTYRSEANSSGYNSNNNLLYRHSFPKKGRTLSVNLSASFNDRKSETILESVNEFFDSGNINDTTQQYTDQVVKGRSYSTNVAYTEPLGKKGQLQFNYSPSWNINSSDQEVFQYDKVADKYSRFDTSLSNRFDNRVTTQNAGVTYRIGDRDNMFSVGLSYRNTHLNSDREFPRPATVDKSFDNILPNLWWRKKFNAKSNIRLFYRASANAPSVTQLQDVVNNNNPLFFTTGNPDLVQQLSHTLSARYTYTNASKGQSFFANVYYQRADDYVGNATFIAAADSVIGDDIILPRGAQISKPVNLNGYNSLRTFLTWGRPLKFMKSNLNLNGGFSWVQTPGLVNKVESVTDNYAYSGGVVLSSNISEYVDFNVSYNVSYNDISNSIQPQLNNNYVNQNVGVQMNLLNKKGWFIQNDVMNTSYSGLSEGFNQSYLLWNAAIGKKFLKNQTGELKLSVFDLLKQNRSITRNVTDSYVEDVQNEVLTQYFMLTFAYRLRNFGTPQQNNRSTNMHGGGRGFRSF